MEVGEWGWGQHPTCKDRCHSQSTIERHVLCGYTLSSHKNLPVTWLRD